MSFGYGVGDFIVVFNLTNDIRKAFVDAPENYKDISAEIKPLSNVLRDIDDVLPKRDLTSQEEKNLEDITQSSRHTLQQLEVRLKKYGILDPASQASKKGGLAERSRKAWLRFRWDQKEMEQFRDKIVRSIAAYSTFLGQISCKATVETRLIVDQIHESQERAAVVEAETRDIIGRIHQDRETKEERQKREKILDWLAPNDHVARQNDFFGRHEEGTGKWFLDSDEFREWIDREGQTLFCPGMPGAGKTIMTSVVIDYLCDMFQGDRTVGVAYVYNNFREQQSPTKLLLSFTKQLAQQQTSLPDPLKSLHEEYTEGKKNGLTPRYGEVLKVLQSVVINCSRAYLLIDALDECQVSHQDRKRILSDLFSLQAKYGVNFFATSRLIHDIASEFGKGNSLEIRASNEDVRKYLEGHIPGLSDFVLRNDDLQEEIKTTIINAVDGMFMLAKLHLESLKGLPSPKAIRACLAKLSKSSDVYNDAYKEAMGRINGQVPAAKEVGIRVLLWISRAKRPLSTSELRHALAIEPGTTELDEENLPETEYLLSVCAGLVTVDEESDVIRLVHYTAQDYFERTWAHWFPRAEIDITESCVTYLRYDIFQPKISTPSRELEERLKTNVLYCYAAYYWGEHARISSKDGEDIVVEFLQCEANAYSAFQVLLSYRMPNQTTGMHLAAYLGLKNAIISLLGAWNNPDLRDSDKRTPLSYAAERGHTDVVKVLLGAGGVDPDSKGSYDQTPLFNAAMNGCTEVVQLLLRSDGVDPDSKNLHGRTPLSEAAMNGCTEVVQLLLRAGGVDPDSKDSYGRTPLSRASQDGHAEVVKLLLGVDGVDPNSRDSYGQTPLFNAATTGYTEVVKILLGTAGVDPDPKDWYNQTPLFHTVTTGYTEVVKILLGTDGVDPHSKDLFGHTPLNLAANFGYKEVVKLLLGVDGVDPDSKDSEGRTPLSDAARYGRTEIVQLLLGTAGVDPDSKDSEGRTPLSDAAMSGYPEVVQLLLGTAGVDPDSKDSEGRTPLNSAAQEGHTDVVKVLLRAGGVDPDSKDSKGRTPLSNAAMNGYTDVVQLLLGTAGVDPDSKGSEGQTPLSGAAMNGCTEVVKILLGTDGVDPHSKDSEGQTPLSWAASRGRRKVVKLLRKKGCI